MSLLGERFVLALAISVEVTWSVRINAVLRDVTPESFLVYGQEVLIVGCACKMNYCMEGPGLVLRKKTIHKYPRPLKAGDAKYSPAQEDCPNPARGEEEGAEGNINKEVKEYPFLDAGIGATARVVFMKTNIDGDILTTYTGLPIREGQMAAVLAAEDYHAGDYEKQLTSIVISFPFREAVEEFDGGEADQNPAIKDGAIVEFSSAFVSNYNCIAFGNESADEKCFKYGRLKDVFHFRAIIYGPAPDAYQSHAKPAVADASQVFANTAQNLVDGLFGISEEECTSAVFGSQRIGGFNFGSYKCKCPPDKSIKGSGQCLTKVRSHTENGKGQKFNPGDFQGLRCKCS